MFQEPQVQQTAFDTASLTIRPAADATRFSLRIDPAAAESIPFALRHRLVRDEAGKD